MKPKIIRIISFSLIAFFHLIFLVALILEKKNAFPISFLLILFLFLTTVTYYKAPLIHEEHFIEDFIAIVFVTLGAISTYTVTHYLKTGPVLAAGIIGTMASFIPTINRDSRLFKLAPASIYCGCFVGMSHQDVAPNYSFIIIAGVITGLFMVISKGVFHGFGGKLGTIAFGGVAFTSFLLFLLY
ncbi:hypothetical protein [Zhouia amylolytica]|uniref:hypothetical protein n=1 Tax=Zhouia amylolytica TaxID=376730 RepID=UPI0006852B69|nr:hypothetical protein [Zhouia amylolytica]